MKKWISLFIFSLLAVFLVACSETETPAPDSDEKSVTELTVEEVYNKAMERQQELTSVSADLKIDQQMVIKTNEDETEVSTKSDMTLDVVQNPLAMYLQGTTAVQGPEINGTANVDMEMYMTEEGLFMYQSETNQWMKMAPEQFDAIMGQAAGQADASEQLEALKGFIDEFAFEQTDNSYQLTLNADGEQFKQFMVDQMELNSIVGLPEEQKQITDNMTFDKLSYVFTVDKETFDITNIDMVVHMNTEADGETVRMTMDSTIVYSNFNGVESIEVPQEVLDQAVEISF